MKRKSLIVLFILLSVFMICSCADEKPVVQPTIQDVVILDFESGTDKGITGFADNNPFKQMRTGINDPGDPSPFGSGGFWMAAGAMQNLPIIPNLKIAKLDKLNAEFAKEKVIDAYGFPLAVDSTVSKADSNSVFVRYYIYDYTDNKMEKGKVGQIDYYYDIKNKTISYREILTPFFGGQGGDNIFVFELIDVPVTIDKNGNGVETISFNVNKAGTYQLIDFWFDDEENPNKDSDYKQASINKFDVIMDFTQTANNGGTKECTVYSTVFDKEEKTVEFAKPTTPIKDPEDGKDSLAYALEVLPEGISKPFTEASFSKKNNIDSGTSRDAQWKGYICDIFTYTISPSVKKGAMIYSGHGSRIAETSYIESVDVVVKNGSATEFTTEFGYPTPESTKESFRGFMSYHLKNCGVAEGDISGWLTDRGY